MEHRSPKARYTRTSRKGFIKQLTGIERRQARLCRIHARCKEKKRQIGEEVAASPEAHHVIGKLQNVPVNIPRFLQNNVDDPVVKVLVPSSD